MKRIMKRNLSIAFALAMIACVLTPFTAMAGFAPEPEPKAPSFDSVVNIPTHPMGHIWDIYPNPLTGGDIIKVRAIISGTGFDSVWLSSNFCNRKQCPSPPPDVLMTSVGGGIYEANLPGDYTQGIFGTLTYEASSFLGSYVEYRIITKLGGVEAGRSSAIKFYPAWPPQQINATSAVSSTDMYVGNTFWVNGTANYWESTYEPGDPTKLIPAEFSDVVVKVGGTNFSGNTDVNGDYSIMATAPIAPGTYMVNTTITNYTPNRNVPCVSSEIQIEVLSGNTSNPVHNINTGEYFNEIQTAIDDPDTLDGHTIEVGAGIYYETPLINKKLSITGESKENTVIHSNVSGDVVYITGSGINFTGFNVSGIPGIMDDSCIKLKSADNCSIQGNIIIGPPSGITLHDSYYNIIKDNMVLGSGEYGLCAVRSDYNVYINNTIELGYIASMALFSSSNNSIYHNSFLNSSVRAQDNTGTNSWDNGYPSGGNYWSDYNGTDTFSGPSQNITGNDGIGDTPYTNIDGGAGAQDNYPLMAPWTPPITYNINLTTGWNLISIPLELADTTLTTVLSSIDGLYDTVKYYDAADANDPWKTCRPGAATNDLFNIDHTMGFWINMLNATILTVEGTEPASTNIPLYAGWNLVSYPSSYPDTVSNALWGTGADRVEAFDPAEPYLIKDVAPTYVMQPGEGYWVHVPADTVWVVDW